MQLPDVMLAAPVADLPTGPYGYEAKFDGYRALLAREPTAQVELRSRRGTVLTEAFPDIAEAARRDLVDGVLLDGELVIYDNGRLAFERLQHRLNRSPGTAAREAAAFPAHFVAFDFLEHAGETLLPLPYQERRRRLERLFHALRLGPPWMLCPMTLDREEAQRWMAGWASVGIEGCVAKHLTQPYRPGVRGWQKIRLRHTTEALISAVTGTLRRPTSLLLGRYDPASRLRYVARTTQLTDGLTAQAAAQLEPGSPQHPWRGRSFSAGWGTHETLTVEVAAPNCVLEFSGDTAVDAGRWRHPVRALRLRPDLKPEDVPAFGTDFQPAVD